MAGVSFEYFTPWANYHLTRGTRYQIQLGSTAEAMFEPLVPVEMMARFNCADLAATNKLESVGRMAELVFDYLKELRKLALHKEYVHAQSQVPGKGEFRSFPSVTIGSGWSFSGLIGADQNKDREAMLDCSGLAGCVMVPDDFRAANSSGKIALAGGGTRLHELADWAAVHKLSIRTSGTHMGMTLAGGMATASHGSRIGFGGIHNMIVGIQLVVGESEAIWIERASRPVLNDAGLVAINPAGNIPASTQIRAIRNDAVFEDVLVHLGCMGIVSAVAVELVADDEFLCLRKAMAIDETWLQRLSQGDWASVAASLGHQGEAVEFYELTVDPQGWKHNPAAHMAYFKNAGSTVVASETPRAAAGGLADSIVAFGARLGPENLNDQARDSLAALGFLALTGDSELEVKNGDVPKPLPIQMCYFDPTTRTLSAYDYYVALAGFSDAGKIDFGRWRDLHGGAITGGAPGSLYNASWAIPRDSLATVLPALCAAVASFPRGFVFTVRFVTGGNIGMAFTRWPETCVIDIDGLSPWIARKVRNRLLRDMVIQDGSDVEAMLTAIEFTMPEAAGTVTRTLENLGVEYSMHFAKRGWIDKGKVQRDFAAPLARWRNTRETLLTDFGKKHFWNWGAVNMGLIERPQ